MNRTIPAIAFLALSLMVSGVALSDSISNNSEDTSSNELFKMMDGNRDGIVSQSEAKSSTMGTRFSAMDSNKDGKVSVTEYQNYMHPKNRNVTSEVEE